MSGSGWSINKDDIDPSEFTEEELQILIWNGLKCAKFVEALAVVGNERDAPIFWAYDFIDLIDGVPHKRTPSDVVQENALRDADEV